MPILYDKRKSANDKHMKILKFKASMDRLSIIITTATTMLLVFFVVTGVSELFTQEIAGPRLFLKTGLILFLAAIPIFCWLFSTKYYTLNDQRLTIHRPFRNREICINEISQVQAVSREDMKGSLRTFGVGGLFGYFGKFWVPQIGAVNAYATQMKNLVLIATHAGEQILISPDDVDLIGQIQEIKVSTSGKEQAGFSYNVGKSACKRST
jgi:hypothetical protein